MPLICWLSVDPVRRKVDFYPKAIALRIEKSYAERSLHAPSSCMLGSDFFNATVHFHPSGSCYQTTPGMSMGRAGFKQPGYRSVQRHVCADETGNVVTVYGKQMHGEWRIASSEAESEQIFRESVPLECCVESGADLGDAQQRFRPWQGSDLTSGAWDVPMVVWQWCRGVPERQGNVISLGDEWWCPYAQDANAEIESRFETGATEAEVHLSTINRTVMLRFMPGTSFGVQRDESRNTERAVRRVIKTMQEIKVMLERMANPPVDVSDVLAALPPDTVPHCFICPISQDIMRDPVKTIDGFTYDRRSIERWFQTAQTSPLTGLPLGSTILEPNAALRQQIDEFVASLPGQAAAAAAAPSQ